MHTFETTVDLDRPQEPAIWETLAVSGDHRAHRIRVRTVQNGTVLSLSGATVWLYCQRQDDSTVLLPGTTDGEWAEAELTRECLELPGSVTLTLVILNPDGTCLSAARTHLLVHPPYDPEMPLLDPQSALPSMTDLLYLLTTLGDARTAAESAAEKVSHALDTILASEADRAQAEAARAWAETERTSKEASRVQAETLRSQAEQDRANAEQKRHDNWPSKSELLRKRNGTVLNRNEARRKPDATSQRLNGWLMKAPVYRQKTKESGPNQNGPRKSNSESRQKRNGSNRNRDG